MSVEIHTHSASYVSEFIKLFKKKSKQFVFVYLFNVLSFEVDGGKICFIFQNFGD